MTSLSSPMSTGLVKPNRATLSAICRICFLEWVRRLPGNGRRRVIAIGSMTVGFMSNVLMGLASGPGNGRLARWLWRCGAARAGRLRCPVRSAGAGYGGTQAQTNARAKKLQVRRTLRRRPEGRHLRHLGNPATKIRPVKKRSIWTGIDKQNGYLAMPPSIYRQARSSLPATKKFLAPCGKFPAPPAHGICCKPWKGLRQSAPGSA